MAALCRQPGAMQHLRCNKVCKQKKILGCCILVKLELRVSMASALSPLGTGDVLAPFKMAIRYAKFIPSSSSSQWSMSIGSGRNFRK